MNINLCLNYMETPLGEDLLPKCLHKTFTINQSVFLGICKPF